MKYITRQNVATSKNKLLPFVSLDKDDDDDDDDEGNDHCDSRKNYFQERIRLSRLGRLDN